MNRVGIDIGGTFIKAGITDSDNNIIISGKAETGLPCESEKIVDNCAALVRRLLAEQGMTTADIEWVGAGIPGSVDCEKGIIEYANNLGFKKLPFSDMMSERLGLPVYIGNDANVAAYGEYLKCGERPSCFILVTLGTGLGGGIIINGEIYTGFNFAGAELGHIVIEKGGIQCTCGRKGCWECYSSVTGLNRMTLEAMEKEPSSLMWQIVGGDTGKIDGRTSFDALRAGDAAAIGVVGKYMEYLACGMVSIINIFQPEVLCIGGGVSAEKEYLIEPLKEAVAREVYGHDQSRSTDIRVATLLNDAGIIGAAALGESCAYR